MCELHSGLPTILPTQRSNARRFSKLCCWSVGCSLYLRHGQFSNSRQRNDCWAVSNVLTERCRWRLGIGGNWQREKGFEHYALSSSSDWETNSGVYKIRNTGRKEQSIKEEKQEGRKGKKRGPKNEGIAHTWNVLARWPGDFLLGVGVTLLLTTQLAKNTTALYWESISVPVIFLWPCDLFRPRV